MSFVSWFSRLLGRKGKPAIQAMAPDTGNVIDDLRAELLESEMWVLDHFRFPGEESSLDSDPRWVERLGEPPMIVVRRLKERGLLVPGTMGDRLSSGRSVKELKALCREHGLKVSGTREELVRRIVKAVPDRISPLVEGRIVLRCSPEAQRLADSRDAESQARLCAAEAEVRQALTEHDLSLACRIAARARGRSDYDPEEDLVALSAAFERWPQLLAFVPESQREPFRMVAAQSYLWGRCPAVWTWSLPDVEGSLDRDVTWRMVVAFMQTEGTLGSLRQSGFKKVRLTRADSCIGCRKGPSVLPIRSAPEIPRPECTNPEGCRCSIGPEV